MYRNQKWIYDFSFYPRFGLAIFILFFVIQKASAHDWNMAGFTENRGQIVNENGEANSEVKFIYDYQGFRLILKSNSFSYEVYSIKDITVFSEAGKLQGARKEYSVKSHRVDICFSGAEARPEISKENKLPAYRNYYNGKVPITNVPSYGCIRYKNIYPLTDLVFSMLDNKPKYDFILHPGANPDLIKMIYKGAEELMVNAQGELHLSISLGNIIEKIPQSFLNENNKNVQVKYKLKDGIVSFRPHTYDRRKTLIIDPLPVLVWKKNLGADYEFWYQFIATDSKDNLVISGSSFSSTIPTPGAYQTSCAGGLDTYIAKFDSSGVLQWATLYGGSADDSPLDLDIDTQDHILIAGSTGSSDGISTSSAQQNSISGSVDGFISKFTPGGSLEWGTYYGGTNYDYISAICTDKNNHVIVTGITFGDPNMVTPGSYQYIHSGLTSCAFIAKFNSIGLRQWGTYYGDNSSVVAVDTDSQDNIIFMGYTSGINFIASPSAFQTTMAGGATDAYIAKFSPAGSRIWGTFYGGAVDEGNPDLFYPYGNAGICVDSKDNIIITGMTTSNNNIASPGSFLDHWVGNEDVFIAKFNSGGKRMWGTFYGGAGNDEARAVAVDSEDNIIVSGVTDSRTGIASECTYQYVYGGPQLSSYPDDVFIVKFTDDGQRIWGTYYGTPGYENNVDVCTNSKDNLWCIVQQTGSSVNALLLKFKDLFPVTAALVADGPVTFCPGDSVKVTAGDGTNYLWENGETTRSVIARNEGSYYATVVDTNGCILHTDTMNVLYFHPTVTVTGSKIICEGDSIILTSSKSYSYHWSNSDTTQAVTIKDGGTYIVTVVDTNGCRCSSIPEIISEVFPPHVFLGGDTILCKGEIKDIHLRVPSANYLWSDGSVTGDFAITHPGTYYVDVVLGPCAVSDTIRIEYISEINFTVPNLITPNNDGKNDFFEIDNILPNTTLEIYNAWGSLLFSSSNYRNEWNGSGIHSGIYYYHLSNPIKCVKKYAGWLHVVK